MTVVPSLTGAKARLIKPPLWERLEEVWAQQLAADADDEVDEEASPEQLQAARRSASPIALGPDGLPFRRFVAGHQDLNHMPMWYRDSDLIDEAVDLMKARLEKQRAIRLAILADALQDEDDAHARETEEYVEDLNAALEELAREAHSDEWFDYSPMWSWDSPDGLVFFIEESSHTPFRFDDAFRKPERRDWPDGNAMPLKSGEETETQAPSESSPQLPHQDFGGTMRRDGETYAEAMERRISEARGDDTLI